MKFIWQLPQSLLALILIGLSKRKETCNYFIDNKNIKVYFVDTVFGCGVSLGNYILLDYKSYYHSRNYIEKTIRHKYGHQKQSLYLGWLYLIVVGLVSAIFNNLWDRLFHKNWTIKQRNTWYYNRFPEKWADKLGEVER